MRETTRSGPRVGVGVGVIVAVGVGLGVEVPVGVVVGLGVLIGVVVGVSVCVAVAVGMDVCWGVNVALGDGVGSRRTLELGGPQAAMNAHRPARRRKALRDRCRCSEDGAIT